MSPTIVSSPPTSANATHGLSPAATSAHYLAGRGCHVFPLAAKRPLANCPRCDPKTRDHEAADCPCLASGDPLAVCHGFHAASADPAVCRARAARWPDAQWALLLGRSSLVALDLDNHGGTAPAVPIPGHTWPADLAPPVDGLECFDMLTVLAGGDALDTLTAETLAVATPSGGRHLIYRCPPDRYASVAGTARRADDTGELRLPASALAWQVDVKCHGGYVLVPGSTSADGTPYRRISPSHVPAPLPGWLAGAMAARGLDRVQRERERRAQVERLRRAHSRPHGTRSGASAVRGERIAAGALRSACAELAAMAPQTGRRNKLFRSASRLAGMVANGWIPEQDVRGALEDAGRACGLTATEIRTNIAGGFRNPRSIEIGGAA